MRTIQLSGKSREESTSPGGIEVFIFLGKVEFPINIMTEDEDRPRIEIYVEGDDRETLKPLTRDLLFLLDRYPSDVTMICKDPEFGEKEFKPKD